MSETEENSLFMDGEYKKNSGSHVTSSDNWIDLKCECMWSVETHSWNILCG